MSDEFKTLIVNGEEVGDYNDDTISFGKWQMATVELWDSPKDFDAYQYDPEDFNEFYKPDVKLEHHGDVEDVDFTPGMNGIKTTSIEEWLLEYVKQEELNDPFYFIVHWRRYAIYKRYEYKDNEGNSEFEWGLEDAGESSPDRYHYKDGKILGDWSTQMEDDEEF